MQNKVGFIDGKTEGIIASPGLTATVLTVTALTRSSNNCLGETQLTVSFSSTNAWLYKDSSRFQIALEKNILLPSPDTEMKCRVNNAVYATCNYTLYSDQEVNTIKTLDVYGYCQENDPCLAKEAISVVIDGLINSYEEWDYSSQDVVFRTHIQDYKNTYVQADIVTAPLKNYFSPSVHTQSTMIDVSPSTPITAFSNVLELTIALNTYLVKEQYLLLTYDKSLLPKSFDNLSCEVISGLVSKVSTCSKHSDSQIKVSDYLESTISQPSRLLVKLLDFVNPTINNGKDSQVFQLISEVQVVSREDRLQEKYSDTSRMAVTVYTKRTNKDCADPNCQYCLMSQLDNCIQCKVPGSAPLLSRDTSTLDSKASCHSECPSGFFLLDQQCLKCNSNCKECLGPEEDDCTACDITNSAYNVFDSGRCANKCKKGQMEVSNVPQIFPVESAKVCSKSDSEECKQDLCGPNCMAESDYCSKECVKSSDAFSFLQKKCVSSCDDGYSLSSSFKDYKVCTQCSDQCKKCLAGSPTTCSECNPLFINKYNYNTACVGQCPFKYFAEPNTNICKTCSEGCSSCRDGKKESCMSCDSDKVYYYGECLSDCPLGSRQSGASCQSSCQNSNCFQCSSESSKCSSCRGLNNILYKDDCLSVCPQGTFQDGGTCKACKTGCKSCSDGLGCDLCTDFSKSVYKGTCVDKCPDGYSRNYLTSVCMQFNCQSPCDQCGFYENECVTCQNNLHSYKLECHSDQCPAGSFTNSTALLTCDTCQSPCQTCSLSASYCETCQSPLMLYQSLCDSKCPMQYKNNSGICEYVQYPTQAAVIVAFAFAALFYLLVSWYKKRLRLHKLNSIIFLCGPLIFFTRVCLLISYSALKQAPLLAITLISLITNMVLGYLFDQYTLVFQNSLPSVQRFIGRHKGGYKFTRCLMYVVGVKVFKVYSSGLVCMPTYHFDRLPPYLFSMNRLLRFSLVLAVFQLVSSLYTISTYNSAEGTTTLLISRCLPPQCLGHCLQSAQ